MQFLSDVYLRCPDCDGTRYRAEVLRGHARGRQSIADVLDMTVARRSRPSPGTPTCNGAPAAAGRRRPRLPALGQPVPTLSGGEAQRLKLAGHRLAEDPRRRRTTAHGEGDAVPVRRADDRPALRRHRQAAGAFRRLLDAGHSLLVIEHNLDVIAPPTG
jgi:excinuclease ABC subunit A